MKKTAMLLALAAVLVTGCNGCMTVPTSKIGYDVQTHAITIDSPKDVTIQSIVAIINPDGSTELRVTGYSSKNNSEVLNAVAQAQAKMQADLMRQGAEMLGAAAKASMVP